MGSKIMKPNYLIDQYFRSLNTYFMGVLGCFYLTQFLTMDKFCCKLFQTSDDQGIKPKLRWLLNNCITKLLPCRQTKYCNSIVLEHFSYFCTSGWSNAVEMRSELRTIRIKCSKVISFLINFTVIFASESNQD